MIPIASWTNRLHDSVLILLLLACCFISGCMPGAKADLSPMSTPTTSVPPAASSDFIRAKNHQFTLAGEPYFFIGTNFWQGMNLGVDGPQGDRERLLSELDDLKEIGITNLRVMAASEGPNSEPYRITPALMIAPGEYDARVLDGLDFFMAELALRGMRAVLVLNNFWYWSGGMPQYVSWSEGSSIPYPGDWDTFMKYTTRFYTCAECQAWYRSHIAMLIEHTNPYTGRIYREDPAIFAWELANEPRRYPETWIDDTARYIKSLDPNHLVTTGSEGTPPGETQDFVTTHDGTSIDYATIHIWPQNWGWYDPENSATYASAEARAQAYFRKHAYDAAVLLQKPLVLEEFGLPRDYQPLLDILNPASPTQHRDQFYTAMFGEVYELMRKGGPAAGANFWAWGGRAHPGDKWPGDPPHEPAGWYSVYDTDASTLTILRHQATAVQALQP